MYIPDIIKKKRDGFLLESKEIEFMVSGYAEGSIPDYQMSAFLMACFIKGLKIEEVYSMTRAMIASGDEYEYKYIEGIIADKHSTGGVGDKVSIPLAPVLAEEGIYVPMVSGRGLGHTGGTLDKLESIAGFNVNLTKSEFKKILKKNKVVMAGQTERFVPADKQMYALRDVTGCVESIQLITASIMSKKIAEGARTLLLDVKFGNGAFMQKYNDAKALAENMFELGETFGRDMIYYLTDMSQPLGNSAGNGIEIAESISILKGDLKNDVSVLVKEMYSDICVKNHLFPSKNAAYEKYEKIISSGRGYERFLSMVSCQDGDIRKLTEKDLINKLSTDIKAKSHGYISGFDTYKIGVSLIYVKAGRFRKEDKIDHKSGIKIHKRIGDAVKKGEPIFTLFHNGKNEETIRMLKDSVTISGSKMKSPQLIKSKRGGI